MLTKVVEIYRNIETGKVYKVVMQYTDPNQSVSVQAWKDGFHFYSRAWLAIEGWELRFRLEFWD